MAKKSNDTFRILLSLALLIGLVAGIAYHRKRTAAKSESEEKSKKLISLDLEKIGKIEVSSKEGTVVLERRPKDSVGKYNDRWAPLSTEFDTLPDWMISSPYNALADSSSASTLVDNLKDLSWEKMISEKGERPADYGLDQPSLTISLFEKGQSAAKLVVKAGEQNSSHSGLYLQTSAEPKIVLGTNALEYLRNRKPNEWRKKEIFGLKELSKVTEFRATYGNPKAGNWVARQENGIWSLVEPKKLPGDRKGIEDLLTDLKALRAEDVVSEGGDQDAKKYGFDKPYATFKIKFDSDAGPQERTIFIGGKIEKNKDLFVRRGEFPQVYTVRSSLKDSLTADAKKLINKKLVNLEKDKVESLTVHVGSEATQLSRKDGKWFLAGKISDEADADRTSLLLTRIIDLRAEDFLGDKAPTGGAKATATIKLNNTQELKITEIKDKNPIVEANGLWYSLPKNAYTDLASSWTDLREKRLSRMALSDVSSLVVKRGKFSVKFTRTQEGKWALGHLDAAEPALRSKLREASEADSIFNLLTSLSIDRFGDKAVVENQDSLIVELVPKTGAASRFLFGAKEGEERPVTLMPRNVTGFLPAERVEEIEKMITLEKKETTPADPAKG